VPIIVKDFLKLTQLARQKKIGLDYAPQDVDLHSDRKIRRLITEFGATGYLVYDYVKLLCFKENGYWLKYDDGFCFDVADVLKSGTTENSVLEILKGCFRIGLFNAKVFKAFRVITSRGIQKRFLEVRKEHLLITEYDLISTEMDENEDLSTENGGLSPKEKEKKEKETKEKERREEAAREIFNDWNLFAEKNGRAKIQTLTDTRKAKIFVRIREQNFDFKKILICADNSSFITGVDGSWFTFDWVIENESNYLKVLEGNYNGKATSKGNREQQFDDVDRELAARYNRP
jgi:hypothetical protein